LPRSQPYPPLYRYGGMQPNPPKPRHFLTSCLLLGC
jgi:hypothetical protein